MRVGSQRLHDGKTCCRIKDGDVLHSRMHPLTTRRLRACIVGGNWVPWKRGTRDLEVEFRTNDAQIDELPRMKEVFWLRRVKGKKGGMEVWKNMERGPTSAFDAASIFWGRSEERRKRRAFIARLSSVIRNRSLCRHAPTSIVRSLFYRLFFQLSSTARFNGGCLHQLPISNAGANS